MDGASVFQIFLASRSRWQCLWPCLLTLACVAPTANVRSPTLEERCNDGSAAACETWGQQLTEEHQQEAADRAFGLACAQGSTPACLKQGKLRMEQGNLEGDQHFVTSWAVPYGRMLVGSRLGERRKRLNLGAEAGVKLFGGPIGHLGVAVGADLHGSMYTVVEAGLDWVLTLMVLAHL